MNLEIKPRGTNLRIIFNDLGQVVKAFEFSEFLNEERDITILVNARIQVLRFINPDELTETQNTFIERLEGWFKDAEFEHLNRLSDQEGA